MALISTIVGLTSMVGLLAQATGAPRLTITGDPNECARASSIQVWSITRAPAQPDGP